MRKAKTFLFQLVIIVAALGVCDHFSSKWSIDFLHAKAFFFFGGFMGTIVSSISDSAKESRHA